MLREEDNKFCADCHAKGPRWASWNLGVFMCIRCAGIHRNLGVHISRVKSVNLDAWTPEQIESIQRGGNGRARDTYEANLPPSFRRPQDDYAIEQFIRSKYERKLYISKESPTTTAAVSAAKTTESKSEPGKARVKNNKKQSSNHKKEQLLGVPRTPAQAKRSITPPAPSTAITSHSSPLTPSTSAPNLIAMETASSKKQQPVDLLTGLPPSSSPQQPPAQQPSLGEDPQRAVKDTILSLYQTQPSTGYQAYTARGYLVNPAHYQQQQAASMRMAQQQQLAQVREVHEQMRHLKMRQGEQQLLVNGQPFMQQSFPAAGFPAARSQPTAVSPQSGGHTLNPHLW